jgi:hypothetical protein
MKQCLHLDHTKNAQRFSIGLRQFCDYKATPVNCLSWPAHPKQRSVKEPYDARENRQILSNGNYVVIFQDPLAVKKE